MIVYVSAVAALLLVAAILAVFYKPLGDYMYHVFTTGKDLGFEKAI